MAKGTIKKPKDISSILEKSAESKIMRGGKAGKSGKGGQGRGGKRC